MGTELICLAVATIGGLLMSRLTKLLNLPAVTAYLVAGLLLGPYCLGALGIGGMGFQTMEQVEAQRILTQTVLGFIAFMYMIKAITIRVDENTVKTNEQTEKFNVLSAFGNFVKNRPALGATLAAMGMFLGMNAAVTANTVMFATYFNMASMSGLVQLIGFLPMFLF